MVESSQLRAETVESKGRLSCEPVMPARKVPTLHDDVRDGLLSKPRSLPAKYFYDDRGSKLFDQICDTQEYYPTRTEDALLHDCASTIVSKLKPQHVIELGSGASRKTRRLFDACAELGCHVKYWPFDVCEEMLRGASEDLVGEYDWLHIKGLVGDYNAGFDHLPEFEGSSLFVFLGGTIGNFEHDQAVAFLSELRHSMRLGDMLLMGADRIKDEHILNAAYNDDAGVTADFNLNLLNILNRELGSNFEPAKFRHHAFFNEEKSQIEMHLIALEEQTISLTALNEKIAFKEGETILTEISRKFTLESLKSLLKEAGFSFNDHFEPDDEYFSLILAEPA